MRWEKGRLGSGYRKLLLARGKRWDLWILDFPSGSFSPHHRDEVPGKEHWRANLLLLGENALSAAEWPGKFFRFGPLVVFRPDACLHCVPKVSRRRLVLSFGWVRERREGS